MALTDAFNLTQIRALLWKDVLVRIRQPLLTVVQNVWVILIFISLYTVRSKFQPVEVDKCEFPTRQLPSKGELLPFFQSYICTIENECLRPNESFSEVSQFAGAPITPLLQVVQTFLNEPTLYDAITELPVNLDFLSTIITIATHSAFPTIQEHVNGFIKLLPKVRTVFDGEADLSKLFSDDRMFSNSGNILCGKPFPRSDNIRFVDRMIYSQDFNGANPDELDVMPTPYCKQLYLDVTNTNNGKITWTLLKPVIQGKIIYGPYSVENEKIMRHANTTFEEMFKLRSFFSALNETIVKIRTDNDTRDNFMSLVELAQSPIVSSVVGNVGVEAVQELLNGILHDKTLLMAVQVIKNILDCFSVDRFVSVPTEKDLERVAKELDDKKLFFAGIYFSDKNLNSAKKNVDYKLRMITDNTPVTYENKNRFWFPGPEASFEFDLRYHRGFIQIQHAVDMAIIKSRKVGDGEVEEEGEDDENKLDQGTKSPLDLEFGDDDDFGVTFDPFELIEDKPTTTTTTTTRRTTTTTAEPDAFGSLVDALQKGNIDAETILDAFNEQEEKKEKSSTTTTTTTTTQKPKEIDPPVSRKKRQMGFLDMLFGGGKAKKEARIKSEEMKYYTKQMSYPKYTKDDFKTGLYLAQSVQMAFFFALIVHVALATRNRIWMRESGNSTLMRAMGLKQLSEHVSWWTINLLELAIVFLIALSILYGGGILMTSGKVFLYVFLMVFGVCTLAFCYMGSTFFSSASIGSVSTVILFLTTFLPYIVVIALGTTLSRSSRFITNLFFSTAFCNCWRHIMRLELQHKEVNFETVFEGSAAENDFTYGFVMLFVDIVLYWAIGFAYERFKNSEGNFYDVPMRDEADSQIGASLEGVSKFYNTDKLAVANVSIVFRRDHITCLLGRNGAGKSTIIKMLTGQLLPSSGELFIAKSSSSGKRNGQVGLCSQNNILIPNLTAKEHLNLYGAIKLNGGYRDEVEKILSELHLEKYEKYRVQELSGGFKRRLSVALAFLGSPNLVILDEPCSGVDQKARKNIWELIERLKKGRALILATHYLDEAEHLSDNILIMNNGKIVTEASPHSLKKELTKSFSIHGTVLKKYSDLNNELEDEIQSELEKVMPNAKFDVKGVQLFIQVKYDERPEGLADVIRLFERFEDEGKVKDFRVISRNLEDIFNALNRINNPSQATALFKHFQKNSNSISNQNGLKNGNGKYQNGGGNGVEKVENKISFREKSEKFLKVIRLLLWKRWTHFRRNYRLLITILLLPAVFEIVAMSFMNLRPPDEHGVALKLNRGLYPNSTEFFSYEFPDSFTETVQESLLGLNSECAGNDSKYCYKFDTSNIANEWLLDTNDEFVGRRFAGNSFNSNRLIVWYNNKGYHSMPMRLNEMNSALFKSELNDSEYSISTVNHPFKVGEKELSTSSILQQVADAGISLILLVAFSLVVAGNSIHIVSERVSGEKLQQKLCGINFWTYWGVTYLWNMALYLIAMLLAVVIFKCYAIPVYVDKSNLSGICLLLFLYGMATIPAVHVFEKLFSDASIANMTIFCLNIIIAMTTITVIILFDVLGDTPQSEKIRDFLNGFFLILPQHALSDGLIQICTNYIKFQVFQIYYIDTYKHPVTSDLIRANYEALILQAIFFMVLNYLIETEWFQRVWPRKSTADEKKKDEKNSKLAVNDLQFVTIQNNKNGLENGGAGENILTVTNVSKCYRRDVKALDNVSFAVKRGECFGLLGSNGAGKSTIFGILSGQLRPTEGNIEMVNGRADGTSSDQIEVSYVPQTNAIDELLTVEEIIRFYGELRKVADLDALVKKTLHAYHLEPYRCFLVKDLSGGNRRKLSVAVACFGKTNLVLMDEPTSDMDPVTRTLVYRAIGELIYEHRSVILTSHTVSEIENVCDRISVLKNGRLISEGTPAELKQLCGNSYLVTVFYDKIEALTVERDIQLEFPSAEKLISHSHSLQFVVEARRGQKEADDQAISENGLRLSDIFDKLHKFCSDRSISYTVSQTLLDRAFEQLLEEDRGMGTHRNLGFSAEGEVLENAI